MYHLKQHKIPEIGIIVFHKKRVVQIMLEYQATWPVWKEQSDPIRLDQLTHCDQYILRQRILPSYFFIRTEYTCL